MRTPIPIFTANTIAIYSYKFHCTYDSQALNWSSVFRLMCRLLTNIYSGAISVPLGTHVLVLQNIPIDSLE